MKESKEQVPVRIYGACFPSDVSVFMMRLAGTIY